MSVNIIHKKQRDNWLRILITVMSDIYCVEWAMMLQYSLETLFFKELNILIKKCEYMNYPNKKLSQFYHFIAAHYCSTKTPLWNVWSLVSFTGVCGY